MGEKKVSDCEEAVGCVNVTGKLVCQVGCVNVWGRRCNVDV